MGTVIKAKKISYSNIYVFFELFNILDNVIQSEYFYIAFHIDLNLTDFIILKFIDPTYLKRLNFLQLYGLK